MYNLNNINDNSCSEPMYAAQVSITKYLPDLSPLWQDRFDFMHKKLSNILNDNDKISEISNSPYLYLGSNGVRTQLLYDSMQNFIYLLDGHKRFTLYDPFQSSNIL